MGLLPDAVPPLRLALAAFANPDGAAAFVSVNVDARAFVHDDEPSTPLQISVTAVDQTGRPVASARQASTVSRPAPAPNGSAAVTVQTHVELQPGDYEVRVAVADAARSSTSSVFSQVVVRAFATDRLSLSDIAIERANHGSSSATAPFLSVAPTTDRTFAASETAAAFLQIYQGTERTDALRPVSLHASIVDAKNRVVDDVTNLIGAGGFHDRRTDYRRLIPTQKLAPGEYLLTIVATAGQQTAKRTVRFSIR